MFPVKESLAKALGEGQWPAPDITMVYVKHSLASLVDRVLSLATEAKGHVFVKDCWEALRGGGWWGEGCEQHIPGKSVHAWEAGHGHCSPVHLPACGGPQKGAMSEERPHKRSLPLFGYGCSITGPPWSELLMSKLRLPRASCSELRFTLPPQKPAPHSSHPLGGPPAPHSNANNSGTQ